MRALLLIAALAGSPDAGVAPAKNSQWKRDANLTGGDATLRCRAELPKCKSVYAVFDAPPHPCAGRGALCTEDLLARASVEGTWVCRCEACASDADCPSGQRCGVDGVVDPCATRLPARRCVARREEAVAQPALQPCPDPPMAKPASAR